MNENIIFQNSKRDNLSGVLSLVNQDINTPIIIFAHGFTSSKNGSSKDLSIELNKLGINAFRFDFYGHGESEGKFENITISEGTDDILQAIKLLKEKGYKTIGLFGTSFGGTCSIIAASKSADISLLALRSPVSDYYTRDLIQKSKEELKDWRENGYRIYKSSGKELKLNYTFYEDMKLNNGFKAGENINIPTLVVQGDLDDSVPVILNEMFIKTVTNSKLKIIKGANHSYSNQKHKEEAIQILLDFIKANLG